MDACGKSRLDCDIALCPAVTQRSFLFTVILLAKRTSTPSPVLLYKYRLVYQIYMP